MKKFYATLAMALATVIGASAAPVIYAYQTGSMATTTP